MRRSVITSADGSVTFKLSGTDESFHSIAGAYEESQHIYIKNGLLKFLDAQTEKPGKINIFETGFGTGLNCLLTICNSVLLPRCSFYYCSVDKYPLGANEIKALNHAEIISSAIDYKERLEPGLITDLSQKMHAAQWNQKIEITPEFELEKVSANLCDYNSEKKFNLFFHDAFSPEINPELWTGDIFTKFARMAAPGALLVTYSSKGTVKQNLRDSGFTVKRFDGINGKRHNLIAQIQF